MDPQAVYAGIQEETGLPMSDVRIGVLDLVGAGLLERSAEVGTDLVWAKVDLFATFDGDFMEWNPEKDARDLAVHLMNLDRDHIEAAEADEALGWGARRFNAAVAYLIGARLVDPIEASDETNYWPPGFWIGDELLRFVRSL